MAHDALADTAGPSSPPPRLPEGWLPQWEGVQRKWYYVQRATGKSQWEIPTEPLVLTPSTTPTSIGTGPSQAPPSRPSTNSPQAVVPGNTLMGRIGSAVESARTSSSLGAQLNGQSGHPMYGPSGTGWYSNQTRQHLAHGHDQQFAPRQGEYGPEMLHHVLSGNPGAGTSAIHPSQSHPQNATGRLPSVRDAPRPVWGNSADVTQGQADGFAAATHGDRYQGYPLGSVSSHCASSHSPITRIPGNQMSGIRPENHPTQPPWQTTQHHMISNAPPQSVSTNPGSSGLSQSFFASYPTPQTTEHPPGNFASQSSQSSSLSFPGGELSGSRAGLHAPYESVSAHSQDPTDHHHSTTGYPLSRSHSHQSAAFQHEGHPDPSTRNPPLHAYASQPSFSHHQYQVTDMARTQSGPGHSSQGFPAAPGNKGSAQYYQNPLVQAGVQQYLPQHQGNHTTAAGVYPGTGYPYHPPSDVQRHWSNSQVSSRVAASDSQFVSGPWASSTPPSSGPQHPHRYD